MSVAEVPPAAADVVWAHLRSLHGENVRPCPNGYFVLHKCGGEAGVWNYRYDEDGTVCVECDCPAGDDPYQLAADLGIPIHWLDPVEHRFVRQRAELAAHAAVEAA